MPAWIEPGTASLCLYCSTLLLRGRAGVTVLSRHLRQGRETVTGVAMDEFSDFLCDHPDALLTILLCSLIAGPRCRLVARAPALLRTAQSRATKLTQLGTDFGTKFGTKLGTKTLTRVQLLHFLRGADPAFTGPLDLQQAQAKPDESGAVRLRPLPANALRLPALRRSKGRGPGAPLHLLRQLAEAVLRGGEAQGACQKALVAYGSGCPLHDGAGDHPIS